MTWLQKTAPEEPPQQKIERLMGCLHNPDPRVRRDADVVLSRILSNYSGTYTADFLVALLGALAEHARPDQLDLSQRYILLLAQPRFLFGRRDSIQVAAQACLDRWQEEEDKRAQPHTLLRPAEHQAGGETLLRPVSDSPPTDPSQLLRSPEPEEEP
jgi:hypothetical protein